LDEISRFVCHWRIPLEDQEEEYTSPTDCQEEGHNSLFFERHQAYSQVVNLTWTAGSTFFEIKSESMAVVRQLEKQAGKAPGDVTPTPSLAALLQKVRFVFALASLPP
jgi:hypothetical protein